MDRQCNSISVRLHRSSTPGTKGEEAKKKNNCRQWKRVLARAHATGATQHTILSIVAMPMYLSRMRVYWMNKKKSEPKPIANRWMPQRWRFVRECIFHWTRAHTLNSLQYNLIEEFTWMQCSGTAAPHRTTTAKKEQMCRRIDKYHNSERPQRRSEEKWSELERDKNLKKAVQIRFSFSLSLACCARI